MAFPVPKKNQSEAQSEAPCHLKTHIFLHVLTLSDTNFLHIAPRVLSCFFLKKFPHVFPVKVVTSMQRHKILTLTKTYLTLSLVEIANEAGLSNTREAEDILFDMISEGEIKAQKLG